MVWHDDTPRYRPFRGANPACWPVMLFEWSFASLRIATEQLQQIDHDVSPSAPDLDNLFALGRVSH